MADIRVKLKNANGDILHPQTEWNLILNKPSVFVAQNQNTTAGTITTEYSKNLIVDSPFYSVTPMDGSDEMACIHYSKDNYLILTAQGSWEKLTAEDIRSYYGDFHSIDVGSHTHTIKGTFK